MDTPESNTVWPPAPTLPPPEAEKREPFRLLLPEWIAVTLKESSLATGVIYCLPMALNFLWTHQIKLREWKFYVEMPIILLVFNGIKNWRKFHPKAK